MKRPKEERERWLRQASHDLEVARAHVSQGFFAEACFAAEQAAQKALKGYLYGRGERVVTEHAIRALLQRAAGHDEATFRALEESGKVLDQYDVATRYPDAIAPPAVPFESYTEDQATEAIRIAEEILGRVQGKG